MTEDKIKDLWTIARAETTKEELMVVTTLLIDPLNLCFTDF